MKFSKKAIFSALLLCRGSLALAADANGALSHLAVSTNGSCGWGYQSSCADGEKIMVSVWLCDSANVYGDCGCTDYFGCTNAAYQGDYYINAKDPSQNVFCDTLGGWRPNDEQYNGVYGRLYKGVHIEVHPADWSKIGGYAGNVKAMLTSGDYCTGPQPEGMSYRAWDDNDDTPGSYGFGDNVDAFQVKAIRPYIDFDQMWGQQAAAAGVGVKMNVWPNRQLSHPYDQVSCPLPNGDYNLPDRSCQKGEDQMWCMQRNGNGAWWKSWSTSEHFPYVPMGSVLFGLYDGPNHGVPCQDTRSDFCSNVDQDKTCLAARFYNKGDKPPDMPDSWDDTFVAETYIKIRDLCDDSQHVCINTSDGSSDPESGICVDGWFTQPDGTPFSNPDGSEQLWWTNYIVRIIDCGGAKPGHIDLGALPFHRTFLAKII